MTDSWVDYRQDTPVQIVAVAQPSPQALPQALPQSLPQPSPPLPHPKQPSSSHRVRYLQNKRYVATKKRWMLLPLSLSIFVFVLCLL